MIVRTKQGMVNKIYPPVSVSSVQNASPGVMLGCFSKLYQHLLQALFSVSAGYSCSHSSYTPYCLHLMPPICAEPEIYAVTGG